MICNCGNPATEKQIRRNNRIAHFWICSACGRELAEGEAAEMQNAQFKLDRLGWYQDTLQPLTFLITRTRMYDLCLLRHSARYTPIPPDAEKYLHGLYRKPSLTTNALEAKL